MTDRTLDEIGDLADAAGIAVAYDAHFCIVSKGAPPVVVCVEPQMTYTLEQVSPDGADVERTVRRVQIVGPVARLAIALHLGLTPGEAMAAGLTASGAEDELQDRMRAVFDRVNAELGAGAIVPRGEPRVILPSDPEWIVGQRTAVTP